MTADWETAARIASMSSLDTPPEAIWAILTTGTPTRHEWYDSWGGLPDQREHHSIVDIVADYETLSQETLSSGSQLLGNT